MQKLATGIGPIMKLPEILSGFRNSDMEASFIGPDQFKPKIEAEMGAHTAVAGPAKISMK